jgi:hypothetical protein
MILTTMYVVNQFDHVRTPTQDAICLTAIALSESVVRGIIVADQAP